MDKPLIVASRRSALARAQVREVMAAHPQAPYAWQPVDTHGDLHKEVSLLTNEKEDIFTDALDEQILRGDADVAVHAAKDLPVPLPEGVTLAALTAGQASEDVLVSTGRRPLHALLAGARVGTSSPGRLRQLTALRPDVRAVGVRGTIEERLRLVETGEVDALIIAQCALDRLGLSALIAETLPFETHPLQGKLAVTCRFDRADMRGLFWRQDARRAYGKVWLVGAGPGPADLLTARAQRAIALADAIFFDDLIDERMLDGVGAERVYVGKRKGRAAVAQNVINDHLSHAAFRGRSVVRLKGGDPSLFARAAEELEHLRRRFIPVEIVPGVTAACAAAAGAAFSLTRRGVSARVSFHSGHCAQVHAATPQDVETRVIYMGASKTREVRDALLRANVPPGTPAAFIRNAGADDEACAVTTVGEMSNAGLPSPVVIVVGAAVAHARVEKKALFTGLDPAPVRLPERIVHQPLIETAFVPVPTLDLAPHDAVVFTSRTAVDAFFRNHTPAGRAVLAIGPGTEARLAVHRCRADVVSREASSDDLARIIRAAGYRSVLYPCSDLSNNILHGMDQVHPVVMYETRPRRVTPLDLRFFASVVFSSPSTVNAFWAAYGGLPGHLLCHVFGETTRKALLKKDVDPRRIVPVMWRRHAD